MKFFNCASGTNKLRFKRGFYLPHCVKDFVTPSSLAIILKGRLNEDIFISMKTSFLYFWGHVHNTNHLHLRCSNLIG